MKDKVLDKKGFTLAEVLIVLAVIGIVAALTIPAVVRSYQETQRKSAVKKAFSTLSRVTNLVMLENGGDMITTPPTENLNGISAYYMDMYAKYIPHTKECRSLANCEAQKTWHQNAEWFLPNGQSAAQQTGGYGYYAAILGNDATMFRFYFYNVNCNYQGTNICGQIHFDINGFKKPNTICKDIFGISVQKDGKFSNVWNCTFKYLNQ